MRPGPEGRACNRSELSWAAGSVAGMTSQRPSAPGPTAPSGTGPAAPPAAEPVAPARVLRTVAEAEAYVASICFKHGPPRLVGVELEWLVHSASAPTAPLDRAGLRAALGPYAPPSLDPRSPSRPLPGGSTVTVEPGGQVELASPPLAPLGTLVRTVATDVEALHTRLTAHGLRPQPRAADPIRPPRRVLDLPRYREMERCFDRIGPWGRSGMCSTAAVQVCVDAGEGADVARRWEAVHALGPVLAGGVRELAGAARTPYGLEILPDGLLAGPRPQPHGPSRGAAGRPRHRLGAPGARHRAAVYAPEAR